MVVLNVDSEKVKDISRFMRGFSLGSPEHVDTCSFLAYGALRAEIKEMFPTANSGRKLLEILQKDAGFVQAHAQMVERLDFEPMLVWLRGRSEIRPPIVVPQSAAQQEGGSIARSKEAVRRAWDEPYRGDAASVLYDICTFWLHERRAEYYGNVITYIQSTGTGKSRTVKELKQHAIVVLMNVASPPSTSISGGYPPPDTTVQQFFDECQRVLLDNQPAQQRSRAVHLRLHGFFVGLLKHLLVTLQELHDDANGCSFIELASIFSERMNEGTFDAHGQFRQEFWKEVVGLAGTFIKANEHKDFTAPPNVDRKDSTSELVRASEALMKWLKTICQGAFPSGPWVVFSIDSARRFIPSTHAAIEYTLLFEFRRVMRLLKDEPYTAILLATGGVVAEPERALPGSFFPVHPRPTVPVCIVPFDVLADVVPNDGSWTLERIASTARIARLGRPLFGALHNAQETVGRQEAVQTVYFARLKLLCGEPLPTAPETDKTLQQLSALSQTLGLHFTSGLYDPRSGAEQQLAERNTRMILSVRPASHELGTFVPSEPLLAEGAYSAFLCTMASGRWDLPRALLVHAERSGVSLGERGEVIGALILLLAVYEARRRRPRYGPGTSLAPPDPSRDGWARTVSVVDFLTALVPDAALESVFGAARMWFNHWIHVDDGDVFDQRCLWAYLARGAGVVCARHRDEVAMFVPYTMGDGGRSEDTGVIMVQVTNRTTPGDGGGVRESVFDAMDPEGLRVFADAQNRAVPVIRLVFALASEHAAVHVRAPPPRTPTLEGPLESKSKVDTFDIWLAGLTHDSSGIIADDAQERSVYKDLLDLSLPRGAPYALDGDIMREVLPRESWERLLEARMGMNPAAGGDGVMERFASTVDVDARGAAVRNEGMDVDVDGEANDPDVDCPAGVDSMYSLPQQDLKRRRT
ncbi:unnamed protein product [Peniophora sp. CBMAI 1063]|nr:unnamed protein product [Peniophora sp. CBMAI 1063]